MITSDKQYEAAREQLRMLEQSLLTPAKKDVPRIVSEAAKRQVQELIDEIKVNIDEYLILKKLRWAKTMDRNNIFILIN